MTIYAVVNDFLAAATSCEAKGPVWTLMSPAAILQGGNPYFVPDFDSRFEARTALALRIGKLGKGIARRFAARYVDAVAPATVFVAANLLNRLRKEGMPWTSAINYDRSLALGRFQSADFEGIARCECTLMLESSGDSIKSSSHTGAANMRPDDIIETLSRDNTLKTGDLLLIGLAKEGPAVRPGLKATLLLNDEEMLRFNIR